MKTTVTKLLILIIIINTIIPMTAFANDTFLLYNRGEVVNLENDLYTYNGDKYIHEDDLYLLNLEWDGNYLSDFSLEKELYITHGSSVVLLNGESFLYPNASVKHNDSYYISVRLIGMFLSKTYDVTENSISLWITDEMYALDFIRGIVSLPNGEVAPAGGISVEVFVTDPDGIAHGGAVSTGGASGGSSLSSGSLKPTISTRIGQLGFNGLEKPSFDYIAGKTDSYVEYEKLVSKNVVIEEGNNSVEFSLSLAGEDFTNSDIGYYTEINGYTSYEFINFSKKRELYEFVIRTGKTDITGTVSLPEISDEDTNFVIVAEGNYGYKYEGTILAGEASAEYSLNVDTQDNYALTLYFADEDYMREKARVDVSDSAVSDINFSAQKSNEYSVTVSLPTDYEAESDVAFDIYLQSASSPYYYISKESAVIEHGNRATTITLKDDIAAKKVIVYYSLSNEYNGLFNFGHYSSSGTSFDCDFAEQIKPINNEIEIELLKSKTITANISIPNNEAAQEDVFVNVEPITIAYPIKDSSMEVVTPPSTEENDEVTTIPPLSAEDGENIVSSDNVWDGGNVTSSVNAENEVSLVSAYSVETSSGVDGGGGGFSSGVSKPMTPVVANPTIKEGEKSGVVTIDIPDEDGYGYILYMSVKGGADSYYRHIYYNIYNSSVLKTNATTVDNKTDEICIELMKQYEIKGNVNAIGFENSYNRIRAIHQKDESIREDVYDSFSVYSDIYGSGAYSIYIPDEFDKYILSLRSFQDGDTIYYKTPKSVESISDAQLLPVEGNLTDINFEYDGYNPSTPIEVSFYQTTTPEKWNVVLSNISDFDKDNISIRIVLYNEGRLEKIVSCEEPVCVRANTKEKFYFTIPVSELAQADVCKLFVWDSSLKPLADVTYIKDDRTGSEYSEKDIALLYAVGGDSTIYSEGREITIDAAVKISNETVYLPLRAYAKTLDMTIEWDGDKKEAVIRKNENVLHFGLDTLSGKLNDNHISINNPFVQTSDTTYAPVRDIAELFGYIVTENTLEEKVAVYEQKNYLIQQLLDNNLIPNGVYGYSINEEIYRKQIAEILVALYERVNGEIEITESNPFTDVDTEEITKAYCAELMNGYEDGTFIPLNGLMESEVITLFQRLLIKSGVIMPTDITNTKEYTDFPKEDNHWATDIVYQMKTIGALDNVFSEEINIDNAATIKDVLAISQNCYDLLSNN